MEVENVWTRKIFDLQRRRKEMEMEENIWRVEEKKNREGKGRQHMET